MIMAWTKGSPTLPPSHLVPFDGLGHPGQPRLPLLQLPLQQRFSRLLLRPMVAAQQQQDHPVDGSVLLGGCRVPGWSGGHASSSTNSRYTGDPVR